MATSYDVISASCGFDGICVYIDVDATIMQFM